MLERIYIDRRFKNDTEQLEKLFELYTKMIQATPQKTSERKPSDRSLQLCATIIPLDGSNAIR